MFLPSDLKPILFCSPCSQEKRKLLKSNKVLLIFTQKKKTKPTWFSFLLLGGVNFSFT